MTNEAQAVPGRLLLIDDDQGQLSELKAEISKLLGEDEVVIDEWKPTTGDVRATLIEKLEPRPVLVVTDHDLTTGGAAGLLGGSVISWCRANAIPVGDYSNKLSDELEEPDLFEFRFSSSPTDAAVQIVELFQGFRELTDLLSKKADCEAESWSQTLAAVLDNADAASAFSLYSVRAGASHVTAIDRIEKEFGEDKSKARALLETYVIGHLLYNGILRYAGPIMDAKVLCSYVAVADDNEDKIAGIFDAARYHGPFGRNARYFWQDKVDDLLGELAIAAGIDEDTDDDQVRRKIVSAMLIPGVHPCNHCGGERGGFRCPYTHRTTCDRADCSVPTTSWIPQGAHLMRVDREYFDRWSPLLGL